MVRGPQPETVPDDELLYTDAAGKGHSLLDVTGSYQGLNRHDFPPAEAKSIRRHITATDDADTARVCETRCFA